MHHLKAFFFLCYPLTDEAINPQIFLFFLFISFTIPRPLSINLSICLANLYSFLCAIYFLRQSYPLVFSTFTPPFLPFFLSLPFHFLSFSLFQSLSLLFNHFAIHTYFFCSSPLLSFLSFFLFSSLLFIFSLLSLHSLSARSPTSIYLSIYLSIYTRTAPRTCSRAPTSASICASCCSTSPPCSGGK